MKAGGSHSEPLAVV